ncbi:unnamed protein product [Thelazia callipaeda]|uniref:GPI ethanolamine phosphate transferase 3 n=1 Tax=Thelazia callipaeda TaxID=103827 RepID=A0A0N5D0J1_THECL|nr:unnamed protein product [Thelazia callipaeda]
MHVYLKLLFCCEASIYFQYVKEGFNRGDVKKALLQSLYEQRKEEHRQKLELQSTQSKIIDDFKLVENKHQKGKGIEKQTYNNSNSTQRRSLRLQKTAGKIRNLSEEKARVEIERAQSKKKTKPKIVSLENKRGEAKRKVLGGKQKQKEGYFEKVALKSEQSCQKALCRIPDIHSLPSTTDFIRFVSLDYSDDPEDLPEELRHFRQIPLVSIPEVPYVASRGACWFPAQYQRVVFIVIDALRYDFVKPTQLNTTYSNQSYSGHFPTITHLLIRESESAVLMHFIADPPTTTMQRLKALTTGSLPTFIDIGSNFASYAVLEDNWIDEIIETNRSIVFLGDDTWVSLYPNHFKRSYHLPSFDVNDLNTVDRMILDNLYHELAKSDWTVLIAHFLGVDHCGHKYGPDHPEMLKKLKQMNEMLAKVISSLDTETLLIVMGDHGMTNSGDHGGDEPQEIDAALFMYAKKQVVFGKPPISVSQVDIVPTISLLLDSPIPYSNIGTLIDCTVVQKHRAMAISSNAEQMMRYGRTVVAQTQLPELDLLIRNFEQNGNLENSLEYMHQLQELLRSFWTEFNENFMRIGFLSLLDTTLAVYNSLYAGNISFSSLVFRSGLFLLQASTFLIGDEENYIAILDFLLSFSLIIQLIRAARTFFSFTAKFWEISVFCIFVAYASSFFSNSFIVFESSIVRFLTQTVVVIAFWQSFLNRKFNCRQRLKSFLDILKIRFGWQRSFAFIIIVAILRIGIIFEKCREEQQNSCEATIFSRSFSRIPHGPYKVMRSLFGVSVIIIAAYFAKKALRKYPSETMTSALIYPTAVTGVASWISHWLPEDTLEYFASFSLVTAQIVYGLSFINLMTICFRATLNRGKFWHHIGCTMSYIVCISSVLLLILDDGLASSFILLITAVMLIPYVVDDEHYQLAFIAFLSSHGFFALSHQPVFTAIPWHAAFVGVPGNFTPLVVPAALVIAHIFASQILTCIVLPMLVACQSRSQLGLSYWTYKLLLFNSLKAISACLMATIHRRHLMMWKIFAPKFIFESISLLVSCVALLITNCIFRNCISSTISHKKV